MHTEQIKILRTCLLLNLVNGMLFTRVRVLRQLLKTRPRFSGHDVTTYALFTNPHTVALEGTMKSVYYRPRQRESKYM